MAAGWLWVPLLLELLLMHTASGARGGPLGSSSGGGPSPWATRLHAPARRLQQSAFCPDGCAADGCVADSTTSGLRCQACEGNLVINTLNGNCACVAGTFIDPALQAATPGRCVAAPKGFYAPPQDYVLTALPAAIACPANMTTLGSRATSIRACVNLPGTSYSISADGLTVAATECPADTYSLGLRRQRSCIPCPTGFTTVGLTARKSPNDCLVPAGFFLKAPGQVAPCPQGEWKADPGASANCTRCAVGVTTLQVASTSVQECKVMEPGFYPLTITAGVVTQAKACVQSFYCPGGEPLSAFDPTNTQSLSADEPTVKRCPNGTWTEEAAAQDVRQCRTPPGFFTSGNQTLKCPPGSFRADWLPAAQASACTPCGEGVSADATDYVDVLHPVTYAVTREAVTSSSEDCYIQPGQGLYFSALSGQWRARNCAENNYGVANRTYGLSAAACRDCPAQQLTSNATGSRSAAYFAVNTDGTLGFTSVRACLNKPGYGYNGRVSQPCDKGSWNPGDTYDNCRACAYGLTTAGVGVGTAETDCGLAAGFGSVGGGVAPCPIGTYNSAAYTAGTTAACTSCPVGRTTNAEGAVSLDDCSLCLPGFGGPGCATECGGAFGASYGPPGRELGSECIPCTTQKTGYSFSWQFTNELFQSPAIATPRAAASTQCLAEFAQLMDGAWYLPVQSDVNVTKSTVADFQACTALCTGACQFVSYNYRNRECAIRTAAANYLSGAPLIAFKTLVSGDVGTNPWSIKARLRGGPPAVRAAGAVPSGVYTMWQEPNALSVGSAQEPIPGREAFVSLQQCLDACEEDQSCAGITMLATVDKGLRPTTCSAIRGDASVGKFIRTVVRADYNRTQVPDLV